MQEIALQNIGPLEVKPMTITTGINVHVIRTFYEEDTHTSVTTGVITIKINTRLCLKKTRHLALLL